MKAQILITIFVLTVFFGESSVANESLNYTRFKETYYYEKEEEAYIWLEKGVKEREEWAIITMTSFCLNGEYCTNFADMERLVESCLDSLNLNVRINAKILMGRLVAKRAVTKYDRLQALDYFLVAKGYDYALSIEEIVALLKELIEEDDGFVYVAQDLVERELLIAKTLPRRALENELIQLLSRIKSRIETLEREKLKNFP